MPQNVLQDRVAVVTGVGRGIGRAIAIAAAQAGARIAALSRSRAELDETVDLIRLFDGIAALKRPTDAPRPSR